MNSLHLRGSHCYLRELSTADAEITYKWRHLDRASQLGGPPTTLENQRSWIQTRPSSELNFTICLHETDEPVGMLSIVDINMFHGSAQTARFLIGEPQLVAGKPIALESMLLAYDKVFIEWRLHKVWGYVAASNWRMIKWQKYLGMKVEGLQREQLIADGCRTDAVMLGLLRTEYMKTVRPRMIKMISLMKGAGDD